MTLRYDRLDNFWFTLMHELAHVHLHLGENNHTFFDNTEEILGSDSEKENDANHVAQEALIPMEYYPPEKLKSVRSTKEVMQIAEYLEISPAIVAGRVANETMNYQKFSSLLGWREVRKVFGAIIS